MLPGWAPYGGVHALSAKNPEERTGGFLALQTGAMLLLVQPAFKPIDYLSWAYRLSGTKPTPDNVLLLRIALGTGLVALLTWKMQT